MFLCWAGWVFDFYDLILYSFLLIPIGQEFGFSKQELSWIYALTLLMTGAGGIAFGMLSDRWGRKTILQYTIVTYCLGTFLSGFANHFAWLLVCRAITGLGVGGEWGAGHALISETFPPKRRGWFGALMQSGAAFGVGLAAVMGAFVAPKIGWRYTFMVSAIPAALVILIRRYLPESDVWLELRSRGQLPKYGALFGQLFASSFRKITILTFILTSFNMCAYWFTYTWFPGYLKEVKHLSITQSGGWTLTVVAGEIAGYTSFGLFSDRMGRKPAFTLFAFLMASGLACIAFAWDFFYAYPALLVALMIVTGIGTGTWSNFGPMFAELYPTHIRNTALNTIYNLARAIQFGTPLLIGSLAGRYGLVSGILLGAFFSFAAGTWIWLLPETRGRIISSD